MAEAPTPYEYGTEIQTGAPDRVYIFPSLISDVLGDWTEPFASAIPILGQMAYETFTLCSTPPPVVEADLTTMIGLLPPFRDPVEAADHIEKLVRQHIWPQYCQPTPPPPGADPLPDPPPPVVPEPPAVDTPLPPPLVGDENPAVLWALMNMKKQLEWLVDQTVTLNYDVGNTFSMSGQGDHIDEDAIGWLVHVLGAPGYLGHAGGTPLITFSLGWVDFGDNNGWFEHRRLMTQDQIFFPCRFYTRRIGWDLGPDVAAQGRPLYKGDGPTEIGQQG